MRPYLIIIFPPLLYQDLGFFKSREDFPVQKLIPKLAVKGFDIAILPVTPRFYKQSLHTKPGQLFSYCLGREFGAIVRTNMLGNTPEDKKMKQEINYILIFDPTGDQYCQTFPGIFINDAKYFKGSAVSRAVYHEIVAPDMVFILWSETDARAAIKP